jgi:hypothetical protein
MDKKTKKTAVLIGVICIALGVIFIFVGLEDKRERLHLRNVCTSEVKGVLAYYDEQVSTSYDSETEETSTTVRAFPVFKYEVDDKTYEHKSIVSGERFKVNTAFTIMYNPQNPKECWIPGDQMANSGIGYIIFACLLFGMGGFTFIKIYVIDKKKEIKNSN